MNTSVTIAWRLFRHEAKRGELSIILLAIVLSVASVLSLSLFSERLQTALTERTAEFMAADRMLSSRKALDDNWLTQAQNYQLDTAQLLATQSMAFANEQMALIELRAASERYPLKGNISVSDSAFGIATKSNELPGKNEAWVESLLLQSLGLNLGDKLEVGDTIFTVSKVLSDLPDTGFSVFGGEPKVLIRYQDFASTNLEGPGSRINYRQFYAGETQQLQEFYDWLKPRLNTDLHRWNSVEDDSSALGQSVKRAGRYFLLASLLAIVLAAVSIAVAAQRYSQRHYDPVAIMKTLGASKAMVQKVYLLQIVFISSLGIIVGTLTGLLLQQFVVMAIADKVDVAVGVWHWRPLFIAIFTGLICSSLFSLYPLLKLFAVPPLRVLRRNLSSSLSARFVQFFSCSSAVFLLMWAYSQDIKISAILLVSGLLLAAALVAASYGLIAVGRRLGQGKISAWQLAWARIKRRAINNSIQLISFSITIMLLLIVLVMRNDMVQQWRDQLPQGTPNYFLININQTQLPQLQQRLEDNNVTSGGYLPVVRGRFVAINGQQVAGRGDENSPNSLGREANLSWTKQLQTGNTLLEGQWLDTWQAGQPYGVSVEANIAKRLNIKLGDTLQFNIGSEIVNVTVSSLREVNWQTMQPNFYFVLQPEAMAAFTPSYISSFYLPTERKPEITRLLKPFGNLSLFDVDARINQLRSIVDQVSMAVEFILVLVLFAGGLVLVAQVQASMDERQEELAILRTLGAKGGLIRASVIIEFVIIGLIAGFMAAVANEAALYMLQSQVFQMQASIHWQYWLTAPLFGAVLVSCLGGLSCWRLLRLNTNDLLRKMV